MAVQCCMSQSVNAGLCPTGATTGQAPGAGHGCCLSCMQTAGSPVLRRGGHPARGWQDSEGPLNFYWRLRESPHQFRWSTWLWDECSQMPGAYELVTWWELAGSQLLSVTACIRALAPTKCKVCCSTEKGNLAFTTVRTCAHAITGDAL